MIKQLTIEFDHRPCLGREDFMVSKCNIDAVKMLDNWPNWPFFSICIYGPEGSGKTHLANVFSNSVSIKTSYPYKIPTIRAKDITNEVMSLFVQHNCLIIEDLHELQNYESMFHIYNHYRDHGGYILFTSKTAPARLNIPLKDLASRLNIVPAVELKEPDDELLNALIVKLFSDRQVNVSPEIIAYMTKNMQRSFAFLRKFVIEIDNISLSQKRAISIPIVKEALENLENQDQYELFEDNKKNEIR